MLYAAALCMIASLVMALLYSRYFLCELFALVRAVRISYARAVRMAAVVLRFLLWPSGGGLNRFCCVLLAVQMPAYTPVRCVRKPSEVSEGEAVFFQPLQ